MKLIRALLILMLAACCVPVSATVNTYANKTVALGNGSQTQFSFSFIGVAAAYIAVIYTDASGNQTTLSQGAGSSQYQISLNTAPQGGLWGLGGTVTYNPGGTPIASGTTLTIYRTLPLTQAISLQNQISLAELGNGAETGLDLGVMEAQQTSETIGRAIVEPIVDPATINLTLPAAAQRANTGIAFDSQGNVIAGTTPATGLISSVMQPVVDAASLALGRTAFGLGGAAVLSPNCQLLSNASAAGNLDVGSVLTQVATNQTVASTFCGQTYIATGPINFTLPRANTLWNGFGFWLHVVGTGKQVTVLLDSHDSVEGQVSGASILLNPNGWSFITTDAASSGTWRVTLSYNYPGSTVATIDNFLPNVQWQQWTNQYPQVEQNSAGTGPQTPALCSGFNTQNNQPVFTCSNTQQIRVGDLIVVATGTSFTTQAYDEFWAYASLGAATCANTISCTPTTGTTVSCASQPATCYSVASRVVALTANTSITIQGYLGGTSPASSGSAYLFPTVKGDTGSLTLTADGWSKTSTLAVYPDSFPAHAYPGAIRTLLTRGGAVGTESVTYTVPANQLGRFQGQTISCGVAAYQTVQGGAATWNISISDTSGTTTSANGSGSSLGSYQFENVTRTVSQTATSISVSLNKTGNSGDVIYWALPTCGFTSSILQGQLHQNSYERIRANAHCNPPLLTPLVIEFTSAVATGLYGWTGIDMEAISLGCWHKSIGSVWGKLEWQTSSLGADVIVGSNVNNLAFGLQAVTAVTGQVFVSGSAPVPLYHDGTFIIFGDIGNLIPTGGTFDFWDGEASPPSTIN